MSRRLEPRIPLRDAFLMRPWRSEDAPALALAVRDPAVRRYAGRLIDDRAQALETIAHWGGGWQDGAGASWAVTAPGDVVIGSVRFALLDVELGTGSVGYWMSPEARGRGLATQAVIAATAEVFRRLGWHRIELFHAVENERSCAVARRAGYRQEGVMREAMRYPVDGRWSDEHLHARLVTDATPSRPASGRS